MSVRATLSGSSLRIWKTFRVTSSFCCCVFFVDHIFRLAQVIGASSSSTSSLQAVRRRSRSTRRSPGDNLAAPTSASAVSAAPGRPRARGVQEADLVAQSLALVPVTGAAGLRRSSPQAPPPPKRRRWRGDGPAEGPPAQVSPPAPAPAEAVPKAAAKRRGRPATPKGKAKAKAKVKAKATAEKASSQQALVREKVQQQQRSRLLSLSRSSTAAANSPSASPAVPTPPAEEPAASGAGPAVPTPPAEEDADDLAAELFGEYMSPPSSPEGVRGATGTSPELREGTVEVASTLPEQRAVTTDTEPQRVPPVRRVPGCPQGHRARLRTWQNVGGARV